MPIEIYIYILAAAVLAFLILVIYFRFRVKRIYSEFKRFLDVLSSGISKFGNIDINAQHAYAVPGINESSGLVAFKKLLSDISRQFKRYSKLLDSIINNTSMGIMIVGSDRKIIKINDSLLSLFNLENSKVIGENIMMVFSNAKLERMIEGTINNRKSGKEDMKFYGYEDLYLNIETIPVEFRSDNKPGNSASIIEETDDEINVLVLADNVTQQVEFSKLRSQFVANVSHEMRTPLTSIRGYLETIIGSGMKDKKMIANRGDSVNDLFLITAGEIYLVGLTPKGYLPLATLDRDDVFGSAPFIDMGHDPQCTSVMASKDIKVHKIDKINLKREYDHLSGTFKNLVDNVNTCVSMTTRAVCTLH